MKVPRALSLNKVKDNVFRRSHSNKGLHPQSKPPVRRVVMILVRINGITFWATDEKGQATKNAA
ncbi:hypothetical protein HMPREF9088_0216 [Enterococcus italicus DSM 15952]|uniref:Uncharacterized protein n=1 Tax=Enterococcus italicus (strain DSM 15952 / CCUG 50447 / LMG 22039 / TP 1.5) TaxID=888064 RepID=E6LCX6_ENTI1|nr:hypothetical protein HMPREF9088_0216 [Enterococcus italicus DSM 15952]